MIISDYLKALHEASALFIGGQTTSGRKVCVKLRRDGKVFVNDNEVPAKIVAFPEQALPMLRELAQVRSDSRVATVRNLNRARARIVDTTWIEDAILRAEAVAFDARERADARAAELLVAVSGGSGVNVLSALFYEKRRAEASAREAERKRQRTTQKRLLADLTAHIQSLEAVTAELTVSEKKLAVWLAHPAPDTDVTAKLVRLRKGAVAWYKIRYGAQVGLSQDYDVTIDPTGVRVNYMTMVVPGTVLLDPDETIKWLVEYTAELRPYKSRLELGGALQKLQAANHRAAAALRSQKAWTDAQIRHQDAVAVVNTTYAAVQRTHAKGNMKGLEVALLRHEAAVTEAERTKSIADMWGRNSQAQDVSAELQDLVAKSERVANLCESFTQWSNS